MPEAHARLCGASSAEGWFACSGRSVMEAPYPDRSGKDADDGTARHSVCAFALTIAGRSVADFVGEHIDVGNLATVTYKAEWVDEDQDYVDTIRSYATGGELFVEQAITYRDRLGLTDERDGWGTADAVVLAPLADGGHELIVADRKAGYHEVPVERNKQLMLYALGAYDQHSLVYDIRRVRLVIHQRGAREWDCSVDELLAFGEEAKAAALRVVCADQFDDGPFEEFAGRFLNPKPNEVACQYCRAQATCPSMTAYVQASLGAEYTDLTTQDAVAQEEITKQLVAAVPDAELGTRMDAVAVVEMWCKAIRARCESVLLAGAPVAGYKLVPGKKGARAWSDAQAAEKQLKAWRLKKDQMYDLALISPTTAEKLLKANPKRWAAAQELIRQNDGKPSVARMDDPRAALEIKPVESEFTAIEDTAEDLI